VWPNTPDILHAQLQTGSDAMFRLRLVLAAMLSASYGIYGPAYELKEHLPRHEGSEEYLDSEKYQLRHWDRGRADSLAPYIAHLNAIRRAHPALQRNDGLVFLPIDNDQLIAWAKQSPDGQDVIITVVNLDPDHAQWGMLDFDPVALGLGVEPGQWFQMHDLLGGERFLWQGGRHYVRLDPSVNVAHVMQLLRKTRSERDFDYYQ
jgi:starch synthase (maltosyl-transferring)